VIAPGPLHAAGIHDDLPESEYRADPAVAQSDLKLLMRSPAHLVAAKSAPKEETPTLTFGRLVHHLALTPELPPWWIVRPAGLDLRTKAGKEWAESVNGASVITQEQFDSARRMIDNLNAHPAWALCSRQDKSKREVSCFGERLVLPQGQPMMDIRVKARIDLVPEVGPALVDLKTTDDARPEQFARSVDEFGYHIQAAFYLDLWNELASEQRDQFCIFAVEKTAPHNVAAYCIHADAITHGRTLYHNALEVFAECVREGRWPGYTEDIRMLNIPRYAYQRYETARIFEEKV